MYAYETIQMYSHESIYMYVYEIHMHTHECICTFMCVTQFIHMSQPICIYMRLFICIHMSLFICI